MKNPKLVSPFGDTENIGKFINTDRLFTSLSFLSLALKKTGKINNKETREFDIIGILMKGGINKIFYTIFKKKLEL